MTANDQQSSATLERRLNDGWDRIETAKSNGEEVTSWEDFWIDLLHRYEQACDAESVIAGWDQ